MLNSEYNGFVKRCIVRQRRDTKVKHSVTQLYAAVAKISDLPLHVTEDNLAHDILLFWVQFASLFASIETARISTIATEFTKITFKVC